MSGKTKRKNISIGANAALELLTDLWREEAELRLTSENSKKEFKTYVKPIDAFAGILQDNFNVDRGNLQKIDAENLRNQRLSSLTPEQQEFVLKALKGLEPT